MRPLLGHTPDVLLYRVFHYLPGAARGASGSPTYLHRPQGKGRWDNATVYDLWYLATSAEAAVGETFGDVSAWGPTMFPTPNPPGSRKALAVFSVPDSLALVDLDDASTLVGLSMRPTQVIIRNRPYTQDLALRIYREQTAAGQRKWDGIRWWSFHRATWSLVALWAPVGTMPPITLERVEQLDSAHAAVRDAARSLARTLS